MKWYNLILDYNKLVLLFPGDKKLQWEWRDMRNKRRNELRKKMDELDDDYREMIPHGTLKVDDLAKLLA